MQKKTIRRTIVAGALALALGVGLVGGSGIGLFRGDPPFTLINLK
jgi:hypothetical protein